MQWSFWSNTVLKWMWKPVNHLCIWPVQRILWRQGWSSLSKESSLGSWSQHEISIGFDGRLQKLEFANQWGMVKKKCNLWDIWAIIDWTGFWSNGINVCSRLWTCFFVTFFLGKALRFEAWTPLFGGHWFVPGHWGFVWSRCWYTTQNWYGCFLRVVGSLLSSTQCLRRDFQTTRGSARFETW